MKADDVLMGSTADSREPTGRPDPPDAAAARSSPPPVPAGRLDRDDSGSQPAPAPLTGYRERLSAATPLLSVSVGCFLLGVYLRWTSNIGPAPAFPIWTLFFALGFVAALGGGFFLVVELEDEEFTARAPVRQRVRPNVVSDLSKRTDRAATPGVMRPATPHIPPRAIAVGAAVASAGIPAAESGSERPGITDTLRVSAGEMLAELDRVMSDLRPVRLSRPPA